VSIVKKEAPDAVVISSVVSDELSEKLLTLTNGFVCSPQSNVPILNAYKTPSTLGMDRLCNAVAAASRMTTQYAVVIDIGTCVKIDVLGKKEGYIGGSIAPGVDLRYKSMHVFTEKLPLLSNKTSVDLVGNSTETSMRSGVMNGIQLEIEGFIHRYESQFSSLTFFMTGGDAAYFDIQAKNDIFAVENLTLQGLFEIYKHNA
jgi:type III pantothenate kinase